MDCELCSVKGTWFRAAMSKWTRDDAVLGITVPGSAVSWEFVLLFAAGNSLVCLCAELLGREVVTAALSSVVCQTCCEAGSPSAELLLYDLRASCSAGKSWCLLWK